MVSLKKKFFSVCSVYPLASTMRVAQGFLLRAVFDLLLLHAGPVNAVEMEAGPEEQVTRWHWFDES